MAANTTSTVNIVIQAVDNASQKIKPVTVAFADLGNSAQNAANKVTNDLTNSVTNFSQKSRGAVDPAVQGFERLNASAVKTTAVMLALGGAIASGFGTAFKVIDQFDRALRSTLGAGVKDLFTETINAIVAEISDASQYSLTEIISAFSNAKVKPIDLGEAVLEAQTASKQIQQSFGAIQLASLNEKAQSASNRIAGIFDGLKGKIASTFDSAAEGVQSRLSSVFQTIKLDVVTDKAKTIATQVATVFQDIAPKITNTLGQIQLNQLAEQARGTAERVLATFQGLPSRISTILQNSRLEGLVEAGRGAIARLVTLFQLAREQISTVLSSPRLEPLVQGVQSVISRIVALFQGVRERISTTLSQVELTPVVQNVRNIADRVVAVFQNVRDRISQTFNNTDFGGLALKVQEASTQALGKFQQKASVPALPAAKDESYQESVQAAATAAAQVVASFENAAQKIPAAFEENISFEAPVQAAKSASNKIAESFQAAAGRALNSFDRIFSQIPKIEQKIAGFANIGQQASGALLGFAGGTDTLKLFNGLRTGVGSAVEAISSGAQQVFYFTQAIDILKSAVVGGPYELLIGQNVRLREQLLATQSTLAATNKVLVGGQRIADPTTAIQALTGPVENAIAKIRKGSLELVNVTSGQLIESFQIIAGEAANIGANLDQAAKLTLSFGSTLGTLGVPLFQARQEIQSILQGTIDQNSVVAKSLGITNEQVGIWKQQNTLVDNLLKKMEAFRAGNKLAAESFGGISSNIQEIIENIGLASGQVLIEPLVGQLKNLYQFLDQNKDAISSFVSGIADNFGKALVNVVEGFGAIFNTGQGALVKTISLLFEALVSVLNSLGNALKTAAVIAEPFVKILEQLIGLRALISPVASLAIQFGVLATVTKVLVSTFSAFANSIPFVGEALVLMQLRGSGVIGLFTGLSKSAGVGAAGLLTLGVNLQRFPFLFNAVASRIPIFGTQIAGLIPTLSATGVAVLSLSKKFPGIGEAVQKAGTALSQIKGLGGAGFETLSKGLAGVFEGKAGSGVQTIVQGFAQIAENNRLLQPLAPTLKNVAFNTDLAAIANQKLAEAAALARNSLIKLVLNFSAITLIVGAAVIAINEFLIKNENNRKILVAIGNALSDFGKKIIAFFTSPLGIALTAVTGLTIAIRTGLVASTLEATQAFIQLAATNTPKWIMGVYEGVTALSAALRGDFSKLGNLLDGGKAKAEAEKITQAIADLDLGIQRRKNLAAKGVTLKSAIDPGEIAQQRAALQQSLEGVTQGGSGAKLFDGFKEGIDKFKKVAQTDVRDIVDKVGTGLESLPARGRAAGAALATGFNTAKGAVLGFLAATGPVLALTAAIYVASEAFNTLSKINDAATASTKRYKEAVEEAITKVEKLEELRRAASNKPEQGPQQTTEQLQGKRIGEIQKGQNFFESTVDNLPFLNEVGKAVGLKGGILATAQLKNEEKGFTATLEEANKKYGDFAKERFNTQKKLEDDLAKLQKDRAEAAAQGKDTTKFDEEIKATQERIKAEKDALQVSIDALSKEQPLNEQQVKDKDALLKKLVELQGQYEKLGQVAVQAIDLPRLGSATEQFQNDINAGLEALAKGTGNKDQVEAKLKATIQGIQELQKSGAITDQQAQAFYTQIASSALISKELQIQAQQGITQSTQEELKKRNENLDADQAEIKGKLAQGVITAEEAEKQITAKKIEQYQAQLDALRDQIAEENRLRATQLQGTLTQLDRQIGETRTKLANAKPGSDEAKAAQGELDALNAKRSEAQQTYENAVKESNRRLANEERKTAGQIAEERAAEEDRRIERERKKAEAEARNRQLTRDVGIQGRLNSGELNQTGADVESARSSKQAADEEVRIEKDKLNELLKNPKKNEEAIRDSRNRILELTKQSLTAEKGLYDAQNRQLEFVQRKAVDIAKAAETQREIEIQRLANKGIISRVEADEKRVNASRSLIQAELQAEQNKQKELLKNPRRNEDAIRESRLRTLDLTKQLLQNEEQAYEAHINTIKDKYAQQEAIRLTALQKRVNNGTISEESQIEEEKARLTVKRLEDEVKLETRNKTKRLQLELELEQAKTNLREKSIAREKERIKNEETATLISVQKRINSGLTSQKEAEFEKARFALVSLEREIQLETRSKSRRLQLELQLEEAKTTLRQKADALADEAIKNRGIAAANASEVEVQALERQKVLYDALNRALEIRVQLLNAAKELGNAGANFISGQLDALAKTEKSEQKKKELAKLTALIKLEALRQEQAIAQVTLDIEIQKNRLALERKDIENQIAIAKQKGEIAKQGADLKVAENQFKRGEISAEELQGKKLQFEASQIQLGGLLQERGLIGKERAIQPFIEEAQRKKLDLEQKAALTQGKVGLFETLSPAEQQRQRKGFQQSLLGDLFGGQFKSVGELIGGTKSRVNEAVTGELTGKKQTSGVIEDAGRLKLPGLKDDGKSTTLRLLQQDFTVNSRDTVKQIEEFRKSNEKIQGNKVELGDKSLEILKGGSGKQLQPVFNVTINTGDKDVATSVENQVRQGIDRVLKLASG